jgi:transposase-like protein
MVERKGKVKARPIPNITGAVVKKAIIESVAWNSAIITDELHSYLGIEKYYAGGHHSTNHRSGEYVRGFIHSNTIEGFFSILKRGLNGIYHSVSKEHLHRYLSEFEFRYNHRELEDGDRAVAAIKGAEGKRLRYKDCKVA